VPDPRSRATPSGPERNADGSGDQAGYSLYILRCADGSLYTGIARDVPRRLAEHAVGNRGAKYLRGRMPVELVFEQRAGDRASAQSLEYRVKRMQKDDKEKLIAGELTLQAVTRPATPPGTA